MRVKREKSFVMPDIEKKKIVVTFVATLGAVLILVAAVLGLVLCKNTMNEKQGLPDIKNCVLDFTGYDTDDKYLKQHMFGTYEFFYNKWIVEESYQGAPDAIVNVPHHYKDTVIDGKRLSSAGYSSYRVIVKGLKVGTPIYFLNNNFVGACYGYVNGELVYKYGTRNKTGNCKSKRRSGMHGSLLRKRYFPARRGVRSVLVARRRLNFSAAPYLVYENHLARFAGVHE